MQPFVNSKHNAQSGFSLVEMSIVLAILSVVLTGLLPFILDANQKANEDITRERMARIEQALFAYHKAQTAAAATPRLPCPASATEVATSSNFGKMANYAAGGTHGTCVNGGAPDASLESGSTTEVAFGMVPVRDLGLPEETAFDGFGRRFSYFVSLKSMSDGTAGEITVQDTNANAKLTDAAFAIVSHGANGHGGYTLGGSRRNASSTNTNEQENCDCTAAAAAGTMDHIVVQGMPTGNARARFDDIVSVYTVTLINAINN